MRFDSFELRTLDGRTLVRDRKSGFCLADHWGTAPGHWPNRKPHFLGDCEQYHPDATHVLMGTTPGLHRPLPCVLPRAERRRDRRTCRYLRPRPPRERVDAPPGAALRQRRGVGAGPAPLGRRNAEGQRAPELSGDRRPAERSGNRPCACHAPSATTNTAPVRMPRPCEAMPKAIACWGCIPVRSAWPRRHRPAWRHRPEPRGAPRMRRTRRGSRVPLRSRSRARALRAGRRRERTQDPGDCDPEPGPAGFAPRSRVLTDPAREPEAGQRREAREARQVDDHGPRRDACDGDDDQAGADPPADVRHAGRHRGHRRECDGVEQAEEEQREGDGAEADPRGAGSGGRRQSGRARRTARAAQSPRPTQLRPQRRASMWQAGGP